LPAGVAHCASALLCVFVRDTLRIVFISHALMRHPIVEDRLEQSPPA
jgi:hypothetical protein